MTVTKEVPKLHNLSLVLLNFVTKPVKNFSDESAKNLAADIQNTRGKNHPKRFDQEVKDGKEPSMAKMLKRLGIGSKKGSNNPTKSEYSGHKSNSVQDLFGKAGSTCKHGYPNTLSSSSSNIHGHHSFDYTESQRHSRSLRKNGPSRASSEKHSHCRSTCEYSSNDSRTETSNPTPPRLLDDYSDPIDVKKDIKENHKLLGRLASLARHNQNVDLQDTSDDDYSVPYEIKKLNREKRLRDQEKVGTAKGQQKAELKAQTENIDQEKTVISAAQHSVQESTSEGNVAVKCNAGGEVSKTVEEKSGIAVVNSRNTPETVELTKSGDNSEANGAHLEIKPDIHVVNADKTAESECESKSSECKNKLPLSDTSEGTSQELKSTGDDNKSAGDANKSAGDHSKSVSDDSKSTCDDSKQVKSASDDSKPVHSNDVISCQAIKQSVHAQPSDATSNQADTNSVHAQPSDAMDGFATSDTRPQQEYEPPWDLNKANSVLLSSDCNSTGSDGNLSHDNHTKPTRHDYVNAHVDAAALTPEQGDVAKQLAGCHVTVVDAVESHHGGARPKEATSCGHSVRQKQSRPGHALVDSRLGNYEEPWDLSCTQNILEEAFLANKLPTTGGSAEDAAGSRDCNPTSDQAPAAGVRAQVPAAGVRAQVPAAGAPQQPSDNRPHEGYEKPWDWKPHKKDEREQEGYEKPWDWKPHQKDERPMAEYDSPWDHRAQNIEHNIVKAKSAKEIKGSSGSGHHAKGSSGSPASQQRENRPPDSRPLDEYDTPWDQKMAASVMAAGSGKIPVARTASDSSQQMSPSNSAVLAAKKSPARRHQSQPLQIQPLPGERIDPQVPLVKQGWYHGAISRVDAETLLRMRKEGSFLVRMSESNKRDFSLSLKSTRGFMHMKIVHKSGTFILGQFSQPFVSIPAMIEHYSLHKLPIKGAEHMSLLHPVMHELL